jgi:hypothetical protein
MSTNEKPISAKEKKFEWQKWGMKEQKLLICLVMIE